MHTSYYDALVLLVNVPGRIARHIPKHLLHDRPQHPRNWPQHYQSQDSKLMKYLTT